MKNHSKSIGLFQKSGSGLYSQMLMEILIFVSIPTFAALTILLIFLAYTTEEISFSPKTIHFIFGGVLISIIAVSARINYLFHLNARKRVIIPLQQLSTAAHAITKNGNFNITVDYHSDDELGQVCDTFRTMQSYLKKSIAERAHANASRKILFSGIAHDLRTPLTAIMGYTEALQLGMGRTKERQMQYLNSIASCADDLSKLIEELSLYNKLSTSRIICHPVATNFSAVIRRYIAEDKDYLASRQVHVSYDMEPIVMAMVDEKEFQRIIFNLLTNTIKYRDTDSSEVLITLKAKDQYAEFTYSDNGPGVPQEKLPHIFEAFYRTDEARSKTSNGSGLGLAIVAEIMTAHKGRYHAVNDHGLKLIFDIPLAEGSKTK